MNLAQKDHQLIWHPYTHQKNRLPAIPIVSAKGSILIDESGNEFIDAISSWWVNIHGHSHPDIAKQIYKQAKNLEHVIFAGFTHQPAVELADRLLPLLPGPFKKMFYSDNGSTAVEVALKMSLQYFSNNNQESKNKIIAFKNSYHGDTFGAMSTSERSIFTKAFNDKLFEVVFIDTPAIENIASTKTFIESIASEVSCFIYEPLIQGAGGMKMYEANLLDEILLECKKQNIICIADEVMTGFFRTGKMFASEYCNTKPDIICLSKGITGGTMALGATVCTQKIFDAFISDEKTKTFFHGHSFTANPISCAAALASLDLIEKKNFQSRLSKLISLNTKFKAALSSNKFAAKIKNIRQCGTIVAFEMITGEQDSYLNNVMQQFTPFCMKRGVYLRSLGNTIYIMPPYSTTKKQMKKVYETIMKFIGQ